METTDLAASIAPLHILLQFDISDPTPETLNEMNDKLLCHTDVSNLTLHEQICTKLSTHLHTIASAYNYSEYSTAASTSRAPTELLIAMRDLRAVSLAVELVNRYAIDAFLQHGECDKELFTLACDACWAVVVDCGPLRPHLAPQHLGKVVTLCLRLGLQDRLTSLKNQVYRPLLVRELLALQTHEKVGVKKRAGNLLTECVLEEGGVLCLVQAFESLNAMKLDEERCAVIAAILSATPKRYSAEPDVYLGNVGSQFCEHIASSQDPAHELLLILAETTIELLDSNNVEAFISTAFKPLVVPRVESTELAGHFKALNVLLNTINSTNCEYVCRTFLPILFYAHSDLRNSTSSLKSLIQDLLHRACRLHSDLAASVLLTAVRPIHPLSFSPGEHNTVAMQMKVKDGDVESAEVDAVSQVQAKVDCLVDLADKSQYELLSSLVRLCLRRSTLYVESKDETEFEDGVIANTVLTAILDRFQSADLEDTQALVDTCTALLQGLIGAACSPTVDQIAASVCGILGAICMQCEMTGEELKSHDELCRILRRLGQESSSGRVRSLAQETMLVLEHGQASIEPDTSEPYSNALKDIRDPLISTQAHGIITLTRLLEQRHPSIEQKSDDILSILLTALAHEDSYIYLCSIHALVALGDRHFHPVSEALLTHLRDEGKSAEIRLNAGEALVRLSRQLGELAPLLGDRLIAAFLQLLGSSPEDPFIAASCLINLGEIAKLMSFRLSNTLSEILLCLEGVLRSTSSPLEIRRAAVEVLHLLLEGADGKVFSLLGDQLLPIHKLLRETRASSDDTLAQSGEACSQLLDGLVKQALSDEEPLLVARETRRLR